MRKVVVLMTMAVVMMFSGMGCDLFASEQSPLILKYRPILGFDLYRKKSWFFETAAETVTITKITINGEVFVPESGNFPITLKYKEKFVLGFKFVPHEIAVTTSTGRTWVFKPDLN